MGSHYRCNVTIGVPQRYRPACGHSSTHLQGFPEREVCHWYVYRHAYTQVMLMQTGHARCRWTQNDRPIADAREASPAGQDRTFGACAS